MPPTNQAPAQAVKAVPTVARQLLEDGEQPIMVVRKSIIVLIGLYLEVLLGVAAFAALLWVIRPATLDDLIDGLIVSQSPASFAIAVLVVALIAFILLLVTLIYLANQLIVAERSLIQVTQRGPFSNKAARLSFSNVEDVSANQSGLLATVFNYGTLTVQTAGTLENFIFTYCPNPNSLAHEILEAQQAYAQSLREDNQNG